MKIDIEEIIIVQDDLYDVTKYPHEGLFYSNNMIILVANGCVSNLFIDDIRKYICKDEDQTNITETTLLKAIAITQNPALAQNLINNKKVDTKIKIE